MDKAERMEKRDMKKREGIRRDQHGLRRLEKGDGLAVGSAKNYASCERKTGGGKSSSWPK
jgi:hypothetical protein